jgi:NAD(P)H-dependent flavin oxidoreductase YrpB (nitropropane dioxygenase family)
MKFIFMLTKNDVTVPDALEVFHRIRHSGVRQIGFKDIGLPKEELRRLVRLMHKSQMETFLEVVSETKEASMNSARSAIELGVNFLIGGTYPEPILDLMRGSGIRFFPYVGRVIGHPCLLRGMVDEIVEDARRVEKLGVDGINLLAYRYDGDVPKLMRSVSSAVRIPVIVAGSIDSTARIREVSDCGAWGFTIGGAIFDKKFDADGDVLSQLRIVLKEVQSHPDRGSGRA